MEVPHHTHTPQKNGGIITPAFVQTLVLCLLSIVFEAFDTSKKEESGLKN
ncbi:MAG TPA: hypothetical protein VF487_13695 [Chitinophagaceae bacterium]